MATQTFTLEHNVWRLLTAANESALIWIRAKSAEGFIFLHRSDTPQGDIIAVGSQDETDAGLSTDTALIINRDERIQARPDALGCVYYAVYVDSRPETVDDALLTVQAPLANIDVLVGDQVSPFNDFFFLQAIGAPTTLTADTVLEDPPTSPGTIFAVASVANFSIGTVALIVSGVSGEERFYIGEVTAINALNVTCDSPMDFAFADGDTVIAATKDLNVNGSVTPQVFEIRAGGPTSTLNFDGTRMIMKCLTDTAVDLSKFADIIGGLTNGLLLRENNGRILNKWNVKTNGDFVILAYDWDPFAATNPVQGQDGFKFRYTLAGPDKHGVAFRFGPNSTLQLIIQDDLTTIAELQALLANHEVVP